ncbi:helix-turn-helix transcriptional regulator, partial [Thioclava sp. BHET1]
ALVVHLLRGLIADHQAEVGLLAGLADPRLAPALTAIHDSPETDWRVEDLAARAGMSRSAFMAHFRQVMRETPIGYLRRWRMDHARQALAGGLRVGSVARRYGYASPEAFSRAFRAAEGIAPRDLRPNRQV